MLLSIIVPVYNKEKKIARCLESLCKIQDSDIEIIVINDGSTDKTESICKKYEQLDQRFCVVNQENAGVSAARNAGIARSKGRYIGFVDADDEITCDYQTIIEALKNENYQMYGFDYCVQKNNSVEVCKKPLLCSGINDKKALCSSFLTGMANSVWTNIYQADIIQKYHIYFTEGMAMGEDFEFNAKYLCHCEEIFYIDTVCYRYYVDDNESAVHRKKLMYLKDFDRIYQAYQTISQLEENLEFHFAYEFYLNFVYGILKQNAGSMTRKQNHEFRHSLIYHVLMTRHYENRRMNLKKWFIRCNLYRFI